MNNFRQNSSSPFARFWLSCVLIIAGLAWHSSAESTIVEVKGTTCVPGFTAFFFDNCFGPSSDPFQFGRDGVHLIPDVLTDKFASGTLVDDRFRFTTGTRAFGTASADLATGELKVLMNVMEGVSDMVGGTRARFQDTVHLAGPTDTDGSDDGLYTFTVSMLIDGIITTDFTNSGSLVHNPLASLLVFGPEVLGSCDLDHLFPQAGGGSGYIVDGQLLSGVCTAGDTFVLSASLSTGLVSDGFVDFSSTGRIGIDFAPGVSFTSDSTVFLTQQQPETPTDPAPIPEPGTLVLLAAGLSGMGAFRRRPRGHLGGQAGRV